MVRLEGPSHLAGPPAGDGRVGLLGTARPSAAETFEPALGSARTGYTIDPDVGVRRRGRCWRGLQSGDDARRLTLQTAMKAVVTEPALRRQPSDSRRLRQRPKSALEWRGQTALRKGGTGRRSTLAGWEKLLCGSAWCQPRTADKSCGKF